MYIEVYISGQLRYRWEIHGEVVVGDTWQERVECRQAITDRYIDYLKANVIPCFDDLVTKFFIVFESKMNVV